MKLKVLNEDGRLLVKSISEAELEKLDYGTLDLLYGSKVKSKSNVILKTIVGIPVVVQSHSLNKSASRFIESSELRSLLHITKEQNFLRNIKEIITVLAENYLVDNNLTFKDIIYEYYDQYVNRKKSGYTDDVDDIPIKLSLYSIVSYNGKLYMIESAVAAAITVFTLEGVPVSYINKGTSLYTRLDGMVEDFKYNHNGESFFALDSCARGPVMNITGYTTWVKHIQNLDDVSPCDDVDLGHRNISDVYIKKAYEVMSLPYNMDYNVYPIDKETFNIMAKFEKERVKDDDRR